MHYYKFNIADWGLGTSHLSLEEEAIYFRLINYYYDNEKPIPLETQSVFRRLRFGSDNELANSILTEFFEETDKGWIHSRCENVLKDYRKTAKKNKVNGAKGGRPKKDVASSISQKKPSGLPDESQNNPNQELLTTNHKPLTKEINPLIETAFDHIWKAYPTKAGKIPAFKSFSKICKPLNDEKIKALSNLIYRDVSTRAKGPDDPFSRLHPTTYFNQQRWTDELTEAQRNGQDQFGSTGKPGKLSAADQVRANIEVRRAERAADRESRGSLDNPVVDVRNEVHEPVRIGTESNMDGRTFENDTGTD